MTVSEVSPRAIWRWRRAGNTRAAAEEAFRASRSCIEDVLLSLAFPLESGANMDQRRSGA